jgi:hypothetical protein
MGSMADPLDERAAELEDSEIYRLGYEALYPRIEAVTGRDVSPMCGCGAVSTPAGS